MSSCQLSETEANRNVNYLASLDFIISLGFGLIMPLFPQYVTLLGGGALEVGILFSSFVLTRAILATPFGNLSDRLGRKRLILIGSFLYGVLAILFTVPESWAGLTLVRGLQGVASAMVWPVSEALVIDSCPVKSRGASFGKIVTATNLGMVIGPFVGAALFIFASDYMGLSEQDSFKFPFYFTGMASFLGFALVWAYVTDAKPPEKERQKVSFGKLLKPDGMDKQGILNLRILYANAMVEGFAWSSIGPLMAYFLPEKFTDLSPSSVSLIIGVAMGLGVLVAYPSGRLSDTMGRKRVFVIGAMVSFIGTILIPFAVYLWATVAFLAIRSMAWQVSSPALRALQADTVPERVRGRLIGMLESMSNFGSVLGAPIGGLLFDQFLGVDIGLPSPIDGTIVPFLVSGVIGIAAATMVLLFVKEKTPVGHPSSR